LRLKADLHIHSTVSDGRASPYEIVYTAIDKGLNIISVTDHNSFRGSVIARRIASNIDDAPVVLVGNEIRTQYGDILVYCLEEPDLPYTLPELIDRAHEENCLVVPAHPFDLLRLGIGDVIYEYSGWDAVEVWNASATHGANKKAMKAAKILGLPGLANSDAHIPEYIGVAYTVIEADKPDPEDILEAIRKGKVHPHPGYPPFKYIVKKFMWSIRRICTSKTRLKNQLNRE